MIKLNVENISFRNVVLQEPKVQTLQKSAPYENDAYNGLHYIPPQPPKIGFLRLLTGFLTESQVNQINLSGRLPENAKFIHNEYGKFTICNNFFGLRVGTQTIPVGFEVKRNVIGRAVVLPKGSTGLMIL